MCLRLGDIDWFQNKQEQIDVVVYAHQIADPFGLSNLSTTIIPRVAERVPGATTVMLGIGKEARFDRKIIEQRAKDKLVIESAERCRATAKHLHLNGFVETMSDPKSLKAAIVQCVSVHLSQSLFSISADTSWRPSRGTPPFSLSIADPALLVPPLPCDTEAGEVKVLILGHAASGKTTLLRRMEEEDARKQGGVTSIMRKLAQMAQPKSTIGVKFKELRHFQKGRVLRILDFAGQPEYTTIHEHFLSQFNGVYVVVIHLAAVNFRSQVASWLHFLQTHPRGPRSDSGILVVCTMVDMLASAETVSVREFDVRQEVSSWGVSKMVSRVEVVLASNKTGDGLDKVWKALRQMALVASETKIPHQFALAQAQLIAKAAELRKVFVTMPEIPGLIQDEAVRKELAGRSVLDDLLHCMHNAGLAVYESDSSAVCLDVGILS
jgi:GTPase SAR1 family protein